MTTFLRNVRRQLYKQVKTTDGLGWTAEKAGIEIGCVSMEIDIDAIIQQLGAQAMSNRSGRSRGMGGLIVVKVVSRKKG